MSIQVNMFNNILMTVERYNITAPPSPALYCTASLSSSYWSPAHDIQRSSGDLSSLDEDKKFCIGGGGALVYLLGRKRLHAKLGKVTLRR
jgi:hypothetical protein